MIFQKARLLLDLLSPRVSELSATAVCFPVETDLPLSRLISLAQETQIYQPLPRAFLWKPTCLSLDFLSPRISDLPTTAVCFPVETDPPLMPPASCCLHCRTASPYVFSCFPPPVSRSFFRTALANSLTNCQFFFGVKNTRVQLICTDWSLNWKLFVRFYKQKTRTKLQTMI